MKLSSFFKKATACLLATLMFATVLLVSPVQTSAYENDKVLASKTQIAAGSTVMLKKDAVKADSLKDISNFWNLFEFEVDKVEDGVATITYKLKGSIIREYGITPEKLITLLGIDENNSVAITLLQAGMAGLSIITIPVTYQVRLEDLTLIKDGIKSTRDELKYIGQEVTIANGAVDAEGEDINNILCMLLYDITTVIDTTAHLQCRLTPGYLENMGIDKEMIGRLVGVDVENELFDLIYEAVTTAGYTINLDVDLKYLRFTNFTDTDTETDTDPDTDTDKPVIKYGDVNSDKKVTLDDVVAMQRYIAKLVSFSLKQRQAGDVAGDGGVDLTDVVYVQRYIAKLIKKFPVENSVG